MADQVQRRINFKYRESPHFRSINAKGVYGGVTPAGEIYMGVYSQRTPSPESSYIDIDPLGKPQQEIITAPQQQVIRDMEIGITMDLNTAEAFKTWLERHINNLRQAQLQQKQQAALMEKKQ